MTTTPTPTDLYTYLTNPDTARRIHTTLLFSAHIDCPAATELTTILTEAADDTITSAMHPTDLANIETTIFNWFSEETLTDYIACGTDPTTVDDYTVLALNSAHDCPSISEALRRALVDEAVSTIMNCIRGDIMHTYGVDIYDNTTAQGVA